MGPIGNGLLFVLIYLPIYFIFTLIQRIYWLCNGMSDIVDQIENDQLYERSAHVFDIQYRLMREPFQLLTRQNFIATHHSFRHPTYVLAQNVSLLSVEQNFAIFVEVPEDYNVYDCKLSPFIFIGQFEKAVRIVTMPISSFKRLGNEIGDPKAKVIWLHSTGRCGSTAYSQIFEVIPDCLTISEPASTFSYSNHAALTCSVKKYRQILGSDEYKELMQAVVRLLTKPNELDPKIIFIKNFTILGSNQIELLENLFPDHIQLFLYRDCLPTAQSYMRSLNRHFWMRFVMSLRRNACLRFLVRVPPMLVNAVAAPAAVDANPWILDSNLVMKVSAFGLIVLQWGCYCNFYVQLQSKNTKCRAIRYEDLLKNKRESLGLLFQFCGISLDHIEIAEKSLEKDSQEGTILSVAELSKYKKAQVTEEMMEEANLYLKAFHLPLLGQPTLLPGCLSPKLSDLNSYSNNERFTTIDIPT